MENKLMTMTNEELTIDTREVADMIGVEHKRILRKLEGTKDRIGIIPTLTKNQMGLSRYFIKSTYRHSSGKENPCKLSTNMGCDLLANKFQGEKGILFTAKYVDKFYKMEKLIKDNQLALANNQIEQLQETVKEFKKITEEAKKQYKPSHKRKIDYNKMIKSLTNTKEEQQIVKDWVFGLLGISKWEDTCVEDTRRIIETITTVSRLLTIKKFEQLSLLPGISNQINY